MNRRDILTSAMGASAAIAAVAPRPAAAAPARTGAAPVVRARDGTVLAHRDWGEGKTIVFLSAWSFCADAWQYQMTPLSQQGFRCVTYDRRGHGRTADPGRGYDFDTLADDLAAVMDTLDLRDVTLVAYSMGSGEAVRYLSRHGSKRVARLLLLAPVTPFLTKTADNPEGIDPAIFERNRATMLKDFPGALEAGFPTFIDQGASEPLKAWVKSIMVGQSLNALIACNKAFTATDLRPDVKAVTVPTLIIHGDADRSAVPALTCKRTAALMPKAELRMYAGAPHGLVFTHTERLNGDIAAFARS
jgi:pimeloyl-ACP methyl ester carboxylesterase